MVSYVWISILFSRGLLIQVSNESPACHTSRLSSSSWFPWPESLTNPLPTEKGWLPSCYFSCSHQHLLLIYLLNTFNMHGAVCHASPCLETAPFPTHICIWAHLSCPRLIYPPVLRTPDPWELVPSIIYIWSGIFNFSTPRALSFIQHSNVFNTLPSWKKKFCR
jgi:hypothetical protein